MVATLPSKDIAGLATTEKDQIKINSVIKAISDRLLSLIATLTTGYDLPGTTTNDSAAAGTVGEYISAEVTSGAPVALTTVTQTNVTSISLTAGDWDIWANVTFACAATTVITGGIGSISATSATLDTSGGHAASISQPNAGFTGGNHTTNPGTVRISLASTTTIYMVAFANFATSTCSAYGYLAARRRR